MELSSVLGKLGLQSNCRKDSQKGNILKIICGCDQRNNMERNAFLRKENCTLLTYNNSTQDYLYKYKYTVPHNKVFEFLNTRKDEANEQTKWIP